MRFSGGDVWYLLAIENIAHYSLSLFIFACSLKLGPNKHWVRVKKELHYSLKIYFGVIFGSFLILLKLIEYSLFFSAIH